MKGSINFNEYYDNHIEYKHIREQNSEVWSKYTDDVLMWKIKFLKEVSGSMDPKNILDVGCAVGFMLNNLPYNTAKENRYGVDISDLNIKTAKEKYPCMNFFSGTINEFSKSHNIKFDLILLSDVIEHVENDLDLLNDASNISNYILVNLPLEKCTEYEKRDYGINDIEGHLRAYNLNDAFKLFEEARLKIINYKIKRYVDQPIFRKYLLNKLLKKYKEKADALVCYEKQLLHIELNQNYYKSNLFVFLR